VGPQIVEFVGDESGAVRGVLAHQVEIVRVNGRRDFRRCGSATELPASSS